MIWDHVVVTGLADDHHLCLSVSCPLWALGPLSPRQRRSERTSAHDEIHVDQVRQTFLFTLRHSLGNGFTLTRANVGILICTRFRVAIFMVFYQGFLFSVLSSMGIIRATQFWTSTNISDGLNALCTTIEMVLISWFQLFAL